jgi:hypothetical protein
MIRRFFSISTPGSSFRAFKACATHPLRNLKSHARSVDVAAVVVVVLAWAARAAWDEIQPTVDAEAGDCVSPEPHDCLSRSPSGSLT